MQFQDYMIKATRAATDEVLRYAEAIPADKLGWKPLDEGRSAIDIMREVAMCPTWAYDIITLPGSPDWSEESMKEQQALMDSWTTLDDCRRELETRLEKLFAVYSELSDDRLKETKWLPFEGGRDFTMAEMLEYPRWNLNYHLGQLAYIQTLYGDKEMH